MCSLEGDGESAAAPEELDQINGPSAVRYRIDNETELYTGRLHIDALAKFDAAHPELEVARANGDLTLEEGFVTTSGRFINANEALDIAHKSRQLQEGIIQRRSRLLSTDLKNPEA